MTAEALRGHKRGISADSRLRAAGDLATGAEVAEAAAGRARDNTDSNWPPVGQANRQNRAGAFEASKPEMCSPVAHVCPFDFVVVYG